MIWSALALANGPTLLPAQDCAADGTVVNAMTGQPVVRAQVMFAGQGAQRGVTTDGTGSWSFSGLPCGTGQFVASRVGFLQASPVQSQRKGLFLPMQLASGSPVHGVKIQLTPQTVIAGRVLDPEGDPVLNARVVILVARVQDGRRTFQSAGSAMTNDLGDYRIPSLPAGKYVVCAYPGISGFVNGLPREALTVGESCYPGQPDSPAAATVDFPAGREGRVDFNLPRYATVRVRGTVSGQPPQRSVGLTLIRRGMPPGAGVIRPAIVRPDGTFEVVGVGPGSYWITSDYYEGAMRWTARVPVQVGGSDVDGVNVRLEQAFSVPGTLKTESETETGQVTARGNPLNFNLREAGESTGGGGHVAWAKDGRSFTIENVAAGVYRLTAFPEGKIFVKSATAGGQDLLGEGAAITGPGNLVEIVLSDNAGAMDVQVEDGDGKPAESAVILLSEGRQAKTLRTNATGRLSTQGLPPGRYQVTAWDDSTEVEYANPDWMRRYAFSQTVTVEAGQTASLKLTQSRLPDR